MKVFKPRTLQGREYERWLQDVSTQVSDAQPLSDNEVMTYMLAYENKPAVTLQDVQDAKLTAETVASDAQTARNAIRMAEDASLLAYIGGW